MDSDDFWHWKMTMKIRFWHFLTAIFGHLIGLMKKSNPFLWSVQSCLQSEMFLSNSIDVMKNLPMCNLSFVLSNGYVIFCFHDILSSSRLVSYFQLTYPSQLRNHKKSTKMNISIKNKMANGLSFNVCSAENLTKHSSVLLLRLASFSAEQTLVCKK